MSAPFPVRLVRGQEAATGFDHDRLDVYRKAVGLVAVVEGVPRNVPAARVAEADHGRRATASTVLDSAEGAGEYGRKEKVRFHRLARRSVAEVGARFAVVLAAGVVPAAASERVDVQADEVSRMLHGLVCTTPPPSPPTISPSPR